MEYASLFYNTNTCWVRFGRGRTTFEQAVQYSRDLLEAAAQAVIGRIIHFSVAKASTDCRLPYFRAQIFNCPIGQIILIS